MGMVTVLRRVDAAERARLVVDQEFLELLLYGDEGDAEHDPKLVDVDKAWHGIHWLLCGSADATDGLGSVILGGREVGDDLGYGPARLLEPDEVRSLSAQLSALDEAEVAARYDADAMEAADLYPSIWSEPWTLEEYVLPMLRDVVAIYRDAAADGDGMLVAVT